MHEKNINTLLSLANACYCKTAVCDVYGRKPEPYKEATLDIVNEKPVNRLQGNHCCGPGHPGLVSQKPGEMNGSERPKNLCEIRYFAIPGSVSKPYLCPS